MPELQCYLLRISVWIHLLAFTSINGLIINKFPLSSLGVRLFYKYDELLYWTENILGNLSSETDAKPNSNLPPPPPKSTKEGSSPVWLACSDFLFVIMDPKTEPGSPDLPRLHFTQGPLRLAVCTMCLRSQGATILGSSCGRHSSDKRLLMEEQS